VPVGRVGQEHCFQLAAAAFQGAQEVGGRLGAAGLLADANVDRAGRQKQQSEAEACLWSG
jgi:hypothetical protein